MRGMRVADGLTSGSISIILPTFEFGGGSVDLSLDYDPAVNAAGGGNPGVTASRASGMGSGYAVGAKIGIGPVTAYAAHATESSTVVTDANDGQNVMVQLVANLGSISIGAGEWYANEENGGNDYSTSGMSVAFNVNDDLSVGYGDRSETYDAQSATIADVTMDSQKLEFAYTMGSMALKGYQIETDNPGWDSDAQADEVTEIAVNFAF